MSSAREMIRKECKTCKKCGATKPILDFPLSKCRLDGHSCNCKACERERTREHYKKNHLQETAKMRERYALNPKKYYTKNKPYTQESLRARWLSNFYIRSGKVKRPTICTECSADGKTHAHHDDYSAKLQVEFLCSSCHGKRHRIDAHVADKMP